MIPKKKSFWSLFSGRRDSIVLAQSGAAISIPYVDISTSARARASSTVIKQLEPQLEEISAIADGGPHSRVWARETLHSAPHRHQQKLSGTRVCRVTFKHLPQPLRSHIRSFGTLGQLFKFSKKNFKKT